LEEKTLALFNVVEYNERDSHVQIIRMLSQGARHMPEHEARRARVIGEKLRAVRQQRQMSLRKLAGMADMSASMLSQIETGKAYPSVRSIYNIASALAVPVDYFFPEQDGRHSPQIEPITGASGEMTASEMREAATSRADNTAPESSLLSSSSTPVMHAGDRPTIELRGGVNWSRLTALAEPDSEFLEIRYAPGATSGTSMSHHNGREFGLVLEGELVVELGFEMYTLGAGDSIIFDSTTPHRLSNKCEQPARALWVVLNQK
jgi:transcriptional regulator with XRE-family HTH domain/mannose-6-phosphate isomerase-like protein (cupin superfamily)